MTWLRIQSGAVGRLQQGALPKPPSSVPSSTVTTSGISSTARSSVARSSGLTKRALMTPTLSPSSRSVCRRLDAGREQRAVGDQHAVLAPFVHFGLSQLDRRRRPIDALQVGLGIAQRRRAGVRQGELQHRRHVQLVAGRHDDEVREQPHVGSVEDAVMRRAVRARSGRRDPGVKVDRQILQGHFLEDLIERALQERGVNVHDGPHAGLGQTGGEGDGVRFADAGVEEARREIGRAPSPACCPGTWPP